MTTIELSDEQAAALQAKAAEQGLTLKAWLQELAFAQAPVNPSPPAGRRYRLAELMAQSNAATLLSDEDRSWLDAPAVGREI